MIRRPPDRLLVSFCQGCGKVYEWARPEERHMLKSEVCSNGCGGRELVVIRYQLARRTS